MIGRLVGDLVDTQPFGDRIDSCVDVNGVGYRVSMTPSTLRELTGMPTAKVTVWVHTHVREDAMTLFGFASRDERSCFELLIGAHGVGPSLAMAILSTLPPTQLRQAVATDDVAALCRVSGVGKKTAQRLLLDLTSAFDAGSEFVDLTESIVTSSTVGSAPRSPEADVRDALLALGYSNDEMQQAIAIARAGSETTDSSALLRASLRALAGAR